MKINEAVKFCKKACPIENKDDGFCITDMLDFSEEFYINLIDNGYPINFTLGDLQTEIEKGEIRCL